jgi:hypothetical protein
MRCGLITQERLRELAHYCPKTGQFTHLQSKGSKKTGMSAGTLRQDGYVYIMFGGMRAFAHRFAWLYMTGEWPTQEIDHIDGNKANNAFANLRQVSRQANTENKRQAKRTSKTGLLGVVKHRNRFVAAITHSGNRTYLGVFETAEAAHAAYLKAKRELHAGCTI